MTQQYSQVWDLDTFFPGGSDSAAFASFLEQLQDELQQWKQMIAQQNTQEASMTNETLAAMTTLLQSIMLKFREADSFVGCLAAENQHDRKAVQLNGRLASMRADWTSVLTRYDELLRQVGDTQWNDWLRREPAFAAIAFPLDERRQLASEKLPPEQEALIGDLAVDGYHGWGEAYQTAVSKFQLTLEENGQQVTLSAGQAANKLSSPDRELRVRLFAQWEQTWGEWEHFTADALNRLAGFRLQMYKHRGWTSVLKEPLDMNRMSAQTLDVMWDVIARNKSVFVSYLQRKAKLLGVEQLSWHDVDAPLGQTTSDIPFDAAANMIVEQFRTFSPQMADFAQQAFDNRWIEAEDRPGKRPGGFCTSFPIKGETRIFMTYANSASNVSTLAHELGHAYHQHVMNNMPALAQEYAMNVAETASTFAELIVSDAAVKQAKSEQEKLVLLEDKIQRSVAFFMNIHARFLFETAFYEERSKGLVDADRLSELMEQAQRQAYEHALADYHPRFWASKLHFYLTDVPFYNFPYTFGYLFSAGIYAVAQQEGKQFEARYVALLRDTGSMTVEQLAQKHLGVDLTQPDFWQRAVDLAIADVEQFLAMTE